MPSVRLLLVLLAAVAVAADADSQQMQPLVPAVAGGAPVFDIVSIKPNTDPDSATVFGLPTGGRVRLVNQTARMLIGSSYGMQDYKMIGGPDWMRSERFDIEAIVEERPVPPLPQWLARIRMLLADRFHLVMHTETRELPVYRLVKARADGTLGPNIRPTSCRQLDTANPNAVANTGIGGGGTCGNRIGPGRIVSFPGQ